MKPLNTICSHRWTSPRQRQQRLLAALAQLTGIEILQSPESVLRKLHNETIKVKETKPFSSCNQSSYSMNDLPSKPSKLDNSEGRQHNAYQINTDEIPAAEDSSGEKDSLHMQGESWKYHP